MPIEERFWSKVDKTGDCWVWTACRSDDGYGKFLYQGKTERAHRVAVILEGSDIPSGMCVCHTCDNPSCVNPDHLWVGSQHDNIIDMADKGRHGHAKLTKQDIADIRRLRPEYTLEQLGGMFGVSYQRIWAICNG